MVNDNWETPNWLMKHFLFHFDPCPLNPRFDGLKINWLDYCLERPIAFVNPPYSNPLVWVEKAIEETKKGVSVVMLLRVDVSTKFYKKIMEQNPHIMFINERLKFSESKNSPSFSNMLVFLEGKNG